jgi:hypothetical protein
MEGKNDQVRGCGYRGSGKVIYCRSFYGRHDDVIC